MCNTYSHNVFVKDMYHPIFRTKDHMWKQFRYKMYEILLYAYLYYKDVCSSAYAKIFFSLQLQYFLYVNIWLLLCQIHNCFLLFYKKNKNKQSVSRCFSMNQLHIQTILRHNTFAILVQVNLTLGYLNIINYILFEIHVQYITVYKVCLLFNEQYL